jgi:16S rRNA (cytidine1402-2'-O)-methyltransferase
MEKGTLFLIPTLLGDTPWQRSLPHYNTEVIRGLRRFIVENEKTARHFIKLISPETDIRSLELLPLNEHTPSEMISSYLDPADLGEDIGLLSEAGCPCIADPGSVIVQRAHKRGIRVVPMVGPSSIVLALMASGMNGQSFAFLGYLSAKGDERIRMLRDIEKRSRAHDETQIFIETPYRNDTLFADILKHCDGSTRLCVAVEIATENESIKSMPVSEWRKNPIEIGKHPAIFLLYHG